MAGGCVAPDNASVQGVCDGPWNRVERILGMQIRHTLAATVAGLVTLGLGVTVTDQSPFVAQQTPFTIRGSASDAGFATGGFAVEFVDQSNVLWVQGRPTGLTVRPGNNPAIATEDSHWLVIFESATNQHAETLGDQQGSPTDLGVQMNSADSPAITALVRSPNSNPTPTPTAAPSTVTLNLIKQPVVSGPIPFAGQFPPFGTTQPGKVLSITYPAAGHAFTSVELLKRGFRSSDCDNPNAVVVLNPGQTTTPDQLTALYGTATTFSTTAPFQAVACFIGTPLPSTISLPMSVQFN